MFYVYVLKSKKDNKLYYGFTKNLEERVNLHNMGKVRSTKSRRPFVLKYYEVVKTPSEARKRELYFKSGSGREYIKNLLNNRAPSSKG